MPSKFRLGLDRQVPRHHATVGGIVNSLCSAENRLQAQITSLRKTSEFRGFLVAVFPWEANFRCFSLRQMQLYKFIRSDMNEAVFQNIRKHRPQVTRTRRVWPAFEHLNRSKKPHLCSSSAFLIKSANS